MRGVLVAAVVSPALLLFLGLVIGRLLRDADRREEARLDGVVVGVVLEGNPAPNPPAGSSDGNQPDERIPLTRN